MPEFVVEIKNPPKNEVDYFTLEEIPERSFFLICPHCEQYYQAFFWHRQSTPGKEEIENVCLVCQKELDPYQVFLNINFTPEENSLKTLFNLSDETRLIDPLASKWFRIMAWKKAQKTSFNGFDGEENPLHELLSYHQKIRQKAAEKRGYISSTDWGRNMTEKIDFYKSNPSGSSYAYRPMVSIDPKFNFFSQKPIPYPSQYKQHFNTNNGDITSIPPTPYIPQYKPHFTADLRDIYNLRNF